ncbi:MAG TPA: 2-hydroxyacid dehydrogenase [Anaerolineae bacterium]|nr:2-hydroxyacid dehydrogenase [Anaerolineae bacterium]
MSIDTRTRAHYPQPPATEYLDQLREQLNTAVRLTTGADRPAPPDTNILIAGRPTRQDLTASPALQTLIIPWAGLPPETRQLMAEFPNITIHNLHHNAIPVAEMVLTLMLSAAKLVLPFDRLLRENDWTPRYRPSPALLLAGKTALILGYGAIGRQVAIYCRGLGMRVIATRRQPSRGPVGPVDELHPASELPGLLPRADALLICLPHTPETDGLIGRRELAMLPQNALLVNVGRGPIVDEAALFHALRDGQLHAAGLDVWYSYPAEEASRPNTPPSAYPFHELDNVVMSPHRAGATADSNALRMEHLAALLNAVAAGETLANHVDVAAGY